MDYLEILRKRRDALKQELSLTEALLTLHETGRTTLDRGREKASRGELKHWLLRLLGRCGNEGMPWREVLKAFEQAYPGKSPRPLYRLVEEGKLAIKDRDLRKTTRLTAAGREVEREDVLQPSIHGSFPVETVGGSLSPFPQPAPTNEH